MYRNIATLCSIIFFVLFSTYFAKGQSIGDISLQLKTIEGNTLIAGKSSVYSKLDKYDSANINYDSSLDIKGVPKNFNNYIIKILDFQPEQGIYEFYLRHRTMDANSLQQGLSLVAKDFAIDDTLKLIKHRIKHFILFLIGETSDGKKVVIADANNNYDFNDDTVFPFEALKKDIEGQVRISYQYAYNKNTKDRFVDLRLSTIKNGFNYFDSIEQNFYLVVYLNEYKSGNFSIKNSNFNFKIINSEAPFIVFKKNIALYYNNNKNNYYNIGDTLHLKSEKYVITAYSYFGDSLYLQHTGFGKIIYGRYPGDYAYNIQQDDIFGAPFNLNNYRGKYVLIDFWGSWCAPCIASIPDLVAFSKKYSTNLQIVSIAEDDANKLDTIKNLITSKKMDWIHLFENINENSKEKIASHYNVQAYPTQILIDPTGKIVFRNFSESRLTEKKLASIIGF